VRTLCPAVLGLEAVALLLAIPVVLSLTSAGPAGGWVLAGLALAAVLLAGYVRRAPGTATWLGWALQVLVLLAGLLVHALVVVALMFAALWWAAVRYGGRVDALRAAADGRPD
jgi:hypothetical protein